MNEKALKLHIYKKRVMLIQNYMEKKGSVKTLSEAYICVTKIEGYVFMLSKNYDQNKKTIQTHPKDLHKL